MYNKFKCLGMFSYGLLINGYMMFHAFKANKRYNEHLAKLSPEELEKKKARNWYLKTHGRFFASGVVMAERMELDVYNEKTPREKESVLTSYRWAQRKEKLSSNSILR